MRRPFRPRTSLAQRNKNPGNIKHSARNKWRGLTADQPGERGFARFETPIYGVRAMGVLFQNYEDKHGLTTVEEIIGRWAPQWMPSLEPGTKLVRDDPPRDENDTERYIDFIKRNMTEAAFADPGSFRFYYELVDLIHEYEAGYSWLSQSQITKGLVLAGIEPPPKKLRDSRTVAGGGANGAAGILTVFFNEVSEKLSQVAPFIDEHTVAIFGTLLFVAGLGTILYARWDDNRKGLR